MIDLNQDKTLQGHSNKSILYPSSLVLTLGWSCDGRKLASGSLDTTLVYYTFLHQRIYTPERLKDSIQLKSHTGDINQLIWDPISPERICSTSVDKTIKLCILLSDSFIILGDTRTQKPTTISTPGENIHLSWSPDGNTLAVVDKQDLISFIDLKTNTIVSQHLSKFEINEVGWDYQQRFYMTTGKGTLLISNQAIPIDPTDFSIELHAHTSNVSISSNSFRR
jgi:THO complex subunit 3